MSEPDGTRVVVSYQVWKRHIRRAILQYLRKHTHVPIKMMKILSSQPNLDLNFVSSFRSLKWDNTLLLSHPEMTKNKSYQIYQDTKIRKWRHKSNNFSWIPRSPFLNGDSPKDRDLWCAIERDIMIRLGSGVSPNLFRKKQYYKYPDFPLELVLHYTTIRDQCDISFLLIHRKWTIPGIHRLLEKSKISFKVFSNNYFLDRDILIEFLDRDWDWKVLATHPSFPPQDIWDDPILFPRWYWKNIVRHPKMTLQFWCHIREVIGETFYSPVLFGNHFQFCPRLRTTAFLKINRFFNQIIWKRRFQTKIKFLKKIINRIPNELTNRILNFL